MEYFILGILILGIIWVSMLLNILGKKIDSLNNSMDNYQAQIGMLDDEISQLREFLKE